MIKLNYTGEMIIQDKLWGEEKENLNIMAKLYKEIMTEAKDKGFNGYYIIYKANEECICEIYENEDAYNNGAESLNLFGFCKPLIDYLESILNSQKIAI